MNLKKIIIKPDRDPESLHKPDDRDDVIMLTQINSGPSDP